MIQPEGQDPQVETVPLLWDLWKRTELEWVGSVDICNVPLMIADKGIRAGMSLPLNVE